MYTHPWIRKAKGENREKEIIVGGKTFSFSTLPRPPLPPPDYISLHQSLVYHIFLISILLLCKSCLVVDAQLSYNEKIHTFLGDKPRICLFFFFLKIFLKVKRKVKKNKINKKKKKERQRIQIVSTIIIIRYKVERNNEQLSFEVISHFFHPILSIDSSLFFLDYHSLFLISRNYFIIPIHFFFSFSFTFFPHVWEPYSTNR